MADAVDWNTKVIEEFRANEGRVGGQFEGAPMLLLHHDGREVRARAVNPMMYLNDDGHRTSSPPRPAPTLTRTGIATSSPTRR